MGKDSGFREEDVGLSGFRGKGCGGRILGFCEEDFGLCGDLILAFVGFRVFVGRRLCLCRESFGLWLGGF